MRGLRLRKTFGVKTGETNPRPSRFSTGLLTWGPGDLSSNRSFRYQSSLHRMQSLLSARAFWWGSASLLSGCNSGRKRVSENDLANPALISCPSLGTVLLLRVHYYHLASHGLQTEASSAYFGRLYPSFQKGDCSCKAMRLALSQSQAIGFLTRSSITRSISSRCSSTTAPTPVSKSTPTIG